MDTELKSFLTYCPLTAVLQGKDETERTAILAEFAALDDASRELLAGDESALAIKAWEDRGFIPAGFGPAVAKLIGFIAFGEVDPGSVGTVLSRLGVPQAQLPGAVAVIEQFVRPLFETPEPEVPRSAGEAELPPMTRPSEQGARQLAGITAPTDNESP